MGVQYDRRVLDRLIRETPEQADALLRGVAEEIVSDIKLSFGPSPSRPGDPPGVVTGDLRASIAWTPQAPLRIFVHDGVVYGVYQELGGEHMPARPFMAPVFEEWRRRKLATFARNFGVFR